MSAPGAHSSKYGMFDSLLLLGLCRIIALMITDSQKCEWKIMKIEEIQKKMKRNLMFQFQTTKLVLELY